MKEKPKEQEEICLIDEDGTIKATGFETIRRLEHLAKEVRKRF